jgi:peptidyl-tRNA hydrolase, PTH1 family
VIGVSGGWVVAGLGNPGPRYQKTRHNAGFLFLDRLADSVSPGLRWRAQFKSETVAIQLKNEDLFLIKPQTFMNLSGEAVQECLAFRKMATERLIVVHDEIDIPLGDIRVKKGGGSAGHNGLKSISERLSSPEYYRIRLGIGRPEGGSDALDGTNRQHVDVSTHVLASFSAAESPVVEEMLSLALKVIEELIFQGLTAAQKACHDRKATSSK